MPIQLVVWLNVLANRLGDVLLAPAAWLPGWLSATLIAIVTGIAMLGIFKCTSNQAAIKRTRNRMKAGFLALTLFQDDLRVSLRSQGRLLRDAARLLALSVVPMLVMIVPTCLLLGQLGLWYQARPLRVGEEAVVTVHLGEHANPSRTGIRFAHTPGVDLSAGPVRVAAKRMVCWSVSATQPGHHMLTFEHDGRSVTKQLAVGDGFMPVSLRRPRWSLSQVLLHPREKPFPAGSPVQSIEVAFPERTSWTSGTNTWLLYWFIVSMAAGFVLRPVLKVHL